ncbi:PIN domain-domain-containing protein [Protomyces lactucae-debilis]|uniref:PIN domain-domain-containing protein n=1 Tax=Protomyces lactucae-debilis TaxID=2754530 RepID=A0A1Y2F967_PROLT|nr:PIN domain-containing protein [Protomyces lactucae-debilis]ORY80460.1 PIN domain-domain-containing protein [Protomyces lactucae-debilis]
MSDMTEIALIEKLTGVLRKGRVKTNLSRDQLVTNIVDATWPEPVARCFVVDTNYWLAHLGLLEGLIQRFDQSRVLLVLPWVALGELDGLKLQEKRYTGTSQSISVAEQAQRANKFISKHLGHAKGLYAQQIDEIIDPNQINDDGILDCARYIKERRKVPVTLLSNDVNLGNKFKVLGMGSMVWENGLQPDDVLRRVLGNWKQGTSDYLARKESVQLILDSDDDDDEHMAMDVEVPPYLSVLA